MKKLGILLIAAVLMASCQKELGGGVDPETSGTIPADFDWKMTQNVKVTVDAPVAGASVPAYAVIRIYSSPILSTENLVAEGVAKAGAPYSTSFTVAKQSANMYVQTTLPDGAKSVAMAAMRPSVAVPGAVMTSRADALPKVRVAAAARVASSMPEYTKLTAKTEQDIEPGAVIRAIESGKNYDLGANWSFYPATEYLIPAGVKITTPGLDLYGNRSPAHAHPVLYVAGELRLANLSVGDATLAVLPGGKVHIDAFSTSVRTAKNVVYVFEGGEFSSGNANLMCESLVNEGKFETGKLTINNGTTFFNAATGEVLAEEFEITNNSTFNSDGKTAVKEQIKLNSSGRFFNYENAQLKIEDELFITNKTIFEQRGTAHIGQLSTHGGGRLNIHCYTVAGRIDGSGGGEYNLAAGARLEAETVHIQGVDIYMASGSLFTMDELNADKKGNKNNIVSQAAAGQLRAVVVIREKTSSKQGAETLYSGRMEIVYNNDADKEYQIPGSYVTDGAYVTAEQSVVIAPSECNGMMAPVDPEPEPEPTEEYKLMPGLVSTFCVEDQWPFLGDYDMNDLVVVTSVDRMISVNGSKVKSIDINWEPKAAGTGYTLAFAVQLDDILASQIASVTSTHSNLGNGPFAASGVQQGIEKAVIPFFNDSKEVLSTKNTYKGIVGAPTTKYKTTIVFNEPVASEALLAVNYFVVANKRGTEIHMPGYKPTSMAELTPGSYLPSEPYKFFTEKAANRKDNYMMWALAIPVDFRYPAESKDIRSAYKYFMEWASSRGEAHPIWYLEEYDESQVY